MSPAKVFAVSAPETQAGCGSVSGRWSGKLTNELRHELVEAQVGVLRLYLEKQSSARLVEALDRLIECTEASFRSEEELMECLTGRADAVHCDAHRNVLAQLSSLRDSALEFDRGRLLARLILIDRELTTHLWQGLVAPEDEPGPTQLGQRPTLHHG